MQSAILLFLVLFLIYLIITKKHYIKVFKGMKAYKLENYKTALEYSNYTYFDKVVGNYYVRIFNNSFVGIPNTSAIRQSS